MKKAINSYANAIKQDRDQLALDYLPALKAMAYRLKERLPSSIEFSDLVSIGTEELIKLARKYDSTINDSFWGYAKMRVHGAMLDYLRSLDCVSRQMRTLIKRVDYEIGRYYNKHQEEPDNKYLSEIIGEEIDKIAEARNASEIYAVMPLDEQLNVAHDEETEQKMEKQELIEVIEQILEKATKNEQLVIQLYYYEELNFREISHILDVSESRISQIHKTILRKIKEEITKGGYDG